MAPLASFSFVLAASLCLCEGTQESIAIRKPRAVPAFAALQTHMPTKQGNVPRLQPQEPASPGVQPKIKLDPDQLRREASELLELSQSLQGDVESINHGLYPKDTAEKLKRIQKVAKHLRGEIAP